jgi:hypothetical protein
LCLKLQISLWKARIILCIIDSTLTSENCNRYIDGWLIWKLRTGYVILYDKLCQWWPPYCLTNTNLLWYCWHVREVLTVSRFCRERTRIAREQLMGSRQYHRLESHYLAYQTFYNSSQEVQEAIFPSYTGKNYFSNQRNELINRVNNPGERANYVFCYVSCRFAMNNIRDLFRDYWNLYLEIIEENYLEIIEICILSQRHCNEFDNIIFLRVCHYMICNRSPALQHKSK